MDMELHGAFQRCQVSRQVHRGLSASDTDALLLINTDIKIGGIFKITVC